MSDPLERNVERLIRKGYQPVKPDPRLERELIRRMLEWQDRIAPRRRTRLPVRGLAAAGILGAAAALWLALRQRPQEIPRQGRDHHTAVLPAPVRAEAPPAVPAAPRPETAPEPTAPPPEIPEAETPAITPATETPPPAPPPAAPRQEEKNPQPPAPQPAPPPETAAPPPLTRVAVARIEAASGEVLLSSDGRRIPAKAGMDLLSSQGLETLDGANASIAFADGTSLQMGASTRLALDQTGLGLDLTRGNLEARVTLRKPDAAIRVRTPHACIETLAASFLISCAEASTRVEVRQGRVRVARSGETAATEVGAQKYAVVGAGTGPPAALPLPQAKPGEPDQRAVDAAVRRGTEYLLKAAVSEKSEELVLWTLLHAGVPADDPRFQALLSEATGAPLARTYNVSLLAMALEEIDRAKYQPLIARCAQFLADNQCRNGQWSYGEPTTYPEFTGAPRPNVATGPRPPAARDYTAGPRAKPPVRQSIAIRKQRDGPASGDNSNSQYAALGIRACHDAGIVFPREVIERAERAWRQGKIAREVGGYPEAGWCYEAEGGGHAPYGSITAGAVGSLAIYDYVRDGEKARSWKRDRDIHAGIRWLANHFTVRVNPGSFKDRENDTQCMLYYYLYALERAGTLCGTENFGPRRWYAEGAAFLLEAQRPDGSWFAEHKSNRALWDTCWAILFLRRATRPLDVASVDAGRAGGK